MFWIGRQTGAARAVSQPFRAAGGVAALTLLLLNISVTTTVNGQSTIQIDDYYTNWTNGCPPDLYHIQIRLEVPYNGLSIFNVDYDTTEFGYGFLVINPSGPDTAPYSYVQLVWDMSRMDPSLIKHLETNLFHLKGFFSGDCTGLNINRAGYSLASNNPRVLSQWAWNRADINPDSVDLAKAFTYGLTTAFSVLITGLGLRVFNRLGNDHSPEI